MKSRPDLGDVSQGKLVTNRNFFELFNGILDPKQLEGLRLLLTPFPQQQFNPLEQGSQVHFMAEFQELLDFPPAPKLGIYGKLDPDKASESEMRGQELFFGKAKCVECHPEPYYTDNTMHNLKTERFFKPRMINGMMASADGPIKTFPLRGIKDTPPYFHDGRLLTLDDAVEFFNMIQELELTEKEKKDLVAFLRTL